MNAPYFFVEHLESSTIVLDEDTSKHLVHVLRMKTGDEVVLTDGRGKKARGSIVDDHRKKCTVSIASVETEKRKNGVIIGISLIKNASRFEWFLEKATEIGVSEIIPLICSRTEKEKFRADRMRSIVISALLQSQQCWLPDLHAPAALEDVLRQPCDQKFIAHCMEGNRKELAQLAIPSSGGRMIIIGPEGDFTEGEVESALENGFIPVALGPNRLRTETAGIVAAALLCIPQ